MKKLSVIFVLLSAVALVLAGCSPKTEEPVVANTTPQPNYLITEGRLMPANYLDISFSVPGQVIEVLVKEGDTVEAGQVIAKLDVPYEAMVAFSQSQLEVQNAKIAVDEIKKNAAFNLAQLKLDVFTAQTLLDEAQDEFDADESEENQLKLDLALKTLELAQEKLVTLEKGNGIDPARLQAAETRVTTAMTAMLTAQNVIDQHELKSTVTGTVAKINFQPGDRINAGVSMMTLADFGNWEIKTDNLTEINVVNVQVGQKVEVILDALPEQTFSGQVSHIDMVYEEKRGDTTYTATIALDQMDPQMRWGMTAAVQFLP
ncbi:MAG: efflux RND transporter periplasmic adaptor subunit [Anaerolineaceae bacterium]|nr:efflux RND transporter periplasmic adaptor subunit [Anaerolineaceae bacterium]